MYFIVQKNILNIFMSIFMTFLVLDVFHFNQSFHEKKNPIAYLFSWVIDQINSLFSI